MVGYDPEGVANAVIVVRRLHLRLSVLLSSGHSI